MKRKVHYSILDDMQKYVKDFNPDDYEKDLNYTDTDVLSYLQDYGCSFIFTGLLRQEFTC